MRNDLTTKLRRALGGRLSRLLFFFSLLSPLLCLFPGDWAPVLRADGKVAAGLPAGGPVEVILELQQPSALEAYLAEKKRNPVLEAVGQEALAQAASRRQWMAVERQQQELLPFLQSPGLGAEILYRVQRVYNGIALKVDAAALDSLASLPGVRSIRRLIPKRLINSTSVPFIGAGKAWMSAGGNATGKGIRIGVIDTGIDYLHTDFGGPGTGNRTNNPNIIGDTPGYFPGPKVAGGYDFAGDTYTGSNSPSPDPDPMDNNASTCDSMGHGTHVAGTIAGFGVLNDAAGSTYPGPYVDGLSPSGFLVGPGVAPEAQLYALKVFGCRGGTSITDQAIEWAVDPNKDGNPEDHLDVINMSLGSDFGNSEDSTTIAANRAAEAGVVVVAAAGNLGDSFYTANSPCVADRVICVAGSMDDGLSGIAMQVQSPAEIAGNYQVGLADFGPALTGAGLSGLVALAEDPADDVGPSANDACSPLTNGAAIRGKIALVWRGTCTFADKVKNSQNAGAIGAIVANNIPGEAPVGMTGGDPSITIPSVMIYKSDGEQLNAKLAGPGVQVLLSSQTAPLPLHGDMVFSASSRGPRAEDSFLKPDITGPGESITSAKSWAGYGASTHSGTSMATPHIAGAMAILKQLHPSWSPQELKALLMNSAADIFEGSNHFPPRHTPARVGAGRIDLQKAGQLQIIAYDAQLPGNTSLNFGAPEVVDTWSMDKSVVVFNKGNTAADIQATYEPLIDSPGIGVSFPMGSRLSLPPATAISLPVRMTAISSQMKLVKDPTLAPTQQRTDRHLMHEAAGRILFHTGAQGSVFRIPVYAVPRPASLAFAEPSPLPCSGTSGRSTLTLRGPGVWTGSQFPQDEISLVAPFELLRTSPDDPQITGIDEKSDLKAVGIRSDYATQKAAGKGVADTTLSFALVTYGNWNSANDTSLRIALDVNSDGITDYTLANSYAGASDSTVDPNDAFVCRLCFRATGACRETGSVNVLPPSRINTLAFNTNLMILSVRATDIGLTDARSRLQFNAESYYPWSSSSYLLDRISGMVYDVAQPGLSFSQPSGDGYYFRYPQQTQIAVDYQQSALQLSGAQGILLLFPHNIRESRTQTIALQFAGSSSTTTTTTTAPPASSSSTSSTRPSTTTSTSTSTTTSSALPTTTTLYPLPAAARLFFPRAVHFAEWTTAVALLNRSGSTSYFNFRIYVDSGIPLATAVRSLPPLNQLAEPMSSLFPGLVLSGGWLEIESSQKDVTGFHLSYNQSATVMDGTVAESAPGQDFLFPLPEAAEISLVNTTEERVRFQVQYFDDSGSPSAPVQSLLPPKGRVALLSSALLPLGRTSGGYLRCQGTGLAAHAAYSRPGWVSMLPGLNPANGASLLYAPQFAAGGGYLTVLDLINLEASPTPVIARLIGDNGALVPSTSSVTVTLPASGSTRLSPSQFGINPAGATLVQGYVQLESASGRFLGAATFTDTPGLRFGSTTPFLPSGTTTSWFSQVAQNEQYYTGVAIVNPSLLDTDVQVEVFSTGGQSLGKSQLTVPSRSRMVRTLAGLLPSLPALSKGYFRVVASKPMPAIALFGTNDGQTLSAIPAQ